MQGLKPAQVKVYDYYETGECGAGGACGSQGGQWDARRGTGAVGTRSCPWPGPFPTPALPELSECRGAQGLAATTLPSSLLLLPGQAPENIGAGGV